MKEFIDPRILTEHEYEAAFQEKIEDPTLSNIVDNWKMTATESEGRDDGSIDYFAYYDTTIASVSEPWKEPYYIGFLIKTTRDISGKFIPSKIWIYDCCPAFLFRTLAKTVHTTNDTCKHVNAMLHMFAEYLNANMLTARPLEVTLAKLSDEFKAELMSYSAADDRMKAFVDVVEGRTAQGTAPRAKRKAKEKPETASTIEGTVLIPRLKKIYDYTLSFLEGKSLLSKTQLSALFFVGPAGTGKTQVANTIMRTLAKNGVVHTEELAGVSIDPNKYAEYLLGADTMEEATVKFQPGIILRGLQATMKEAKENLVILIHEFNRSTGLIHLDGILRSIGDTGYIQFNSQAENMPDVIKALDPLPIEYIGGSLYRVDLNKIDEHIRFLLTGNIGTEYQVQEIPQALRGRLMFMNFPNYTPAEMEDIFNGAPNFATLSDPEKRMTLSTYSMFCNLLNNAQTDSLPRITEILGVVDFAFVDPTLAAENLRAQIGEENLPDGTFKDLVTLFSKKGEETEEVEPAKA